MFNLFKKKPQSNHMSMALIQAGLVNNPDICIANMSTSFMCVCNECKEKYKKQIDEVLKKLEQEVK